MDKRYDGIITSHTVVIAFSQFIDKNHPHGDVEGLLHTGIGLNILGNDNFEVCVSCEKSKFKEYTTIGAVIDEEGFRYLSMQDPKRYLLWEERIVSQDEAELIRRGVGKIKSITLESPWSAGTEYQFVIDTKSDIIHEAILIERGE